MASKNTDVATDNAAAKKRQPPKIAATFEIQGPDGAKVELPAGARIVVTSVTRDLTAFAERVLDNPAGIGLYTKIEVPFVEA